MQYSSSHSDWGYSPASGSWRHQVGGNAASDRGVPWMNVDNSYSTPGVHHAASARTFPPPSGEHYDTMTHNINLSITMGGNVSSPKPDGLGLIRYRAPDVESFIFDHDKGYRFDPTTGLHYDANSKFFINHELRILLSWDPLTNTYRRAGDLVSLRPAGKVIPWDAPSVTAHDQVEEKPRISEGSSRRRSVSPARQKYDSREFFHFGRIKRSRSRSTSSGKYSRSRRSRTRSPERRGERHWHRSDSGNARRNGSQMSKRCSPSPRPHKTDRQRSRNRSASRDRYPRSWRSRTRSVERKRERRWPRGDSGSTKMNDCKRSKRCSPSPRPYKTERQRSRSRSLSCSKPPKSCRSRTRSVERRGERHWHKSNNGNTKMNASTMSKHCARSPRPHKAERQRSRSRSLSCIKQPKSWRSRTGSVERRGERLRRRRDSGNTKMNDSQVRKNRSPSPRPHKMERQRSRSRSATNQKQPRSWPSRTKNIEIKGESTGTAGGSSREDSQMTKGLSLLPRQGPVQKARLPVTSRKVTLRDGEPQDSSLSTKIERERDVWNRLGPSYKRENSGSVGLEDSEREIQTPVTARTVHLVQTCDLERSRSQSCCREFTSEDEEYMFEDDCLVRVDDDLFDDDEAPENPDDCLDDDLCYDDEAPENPDDCLDDDLCYDDEAPENPDDCFDDDVCYDDEAPENPDDCLVTVDDNLCYDDEASENPDDCLVTADDDLFYDDEALENPDDCLITVDDDLFYDDEAAENPEVEPTGKYLEARDYYSPFDLQPEVRWSRDKPAPSQKATPIEGITTNQRSDRREVKSENAVESHSSKKKLKEEILSDVERSKQSHSVSTRSRRVVDVSASQRKPNSPAMHQEDSSRRAETDGSGRCRAWRSNEQSRDRSGIRRSVGREVVRNRSGTHTEDARRSRSREPTTYHVMMSQRRDFGELRRRRTSSRGSGRSDESLISDFRDSRSGKSRTREMKRNSSIVTGKYHRFSRDSSLSLSLSSIDGEFVSGVTRMSCERELDEKIRCSPSLVKREPLSRGSNIHQRSGSSDRMQHGRSPSRGTARKIGVHNLRDPSPKRRKYESRGDTPFSSKSEGYRHVDIVKSHSNRTNCRDSASLSHESTVLGSLPENEPKQKIRTNTRAVVVNSPVSLCENPSRREDNPRGTPAGVPIEKPLSEGEAPAPSGKTAEEASGVVVVDEHSAANETPKPVGKTPEEAPKVVLIQELRLENETPKPIEEAAGVVDIVKEVAANETPKLAGKKPEESPEVVLIHEPLLKGEAPKREEALGVVAIDKELAANETPKLPGKEPEETPKVVLIHEPLLKDEAPKREETPGVVANDQPLSELSIQSFYSIHFEDLEPTKETPKSAPNVLLIDKLMSEGEAPPPGGKRLEEAPGVVFIEEPLAASEPPKPIGMIIEQNPKAVLSHKPVPKNEAPKPREETPEVVGDDLSLPEREALQPTEENSEGTHKVVLVRKPLPESKVPKPREETAEETPEVVIPDQPLKNEAVAYTKETSEVTPECTVIDDGDVLGHLFTNDDNTKTNIILVAPVPPSAHSKNASDNLKNQIGLPKDVLKVYVSYENTSGSPCRFMVVSFKTSYAAKQWYDSLRGTIVLDGEDGTKLKGYLHFMKKGNWNCKHCKSFNFFMQSLCSKCYQAKGGGFSPVTISKEPTKWVGIARLNNRFSTTDSVTESLPPLRTFNIVDVEIFREPSGLHLGLCVFEVESIEEASRLHEFFLLHERDAIYVVVNEKPKTPDEEYLSLLFDKKTPTNILLVAVIPQAKTPDIRLELSSTKKYILMLLKQDGVKYNKIVVNLDKIVGAPYSYVLITFADSETATQWLKTRRKTLTERYQCSPKLSEEGSKMSPFFSEDNWRCLGCHNANFYLRSLCRRCFRHRKPNVVGPISQSSTPTRWVAIPELSSWSKKDECIAADFRELLKEFILKRVEVIRDSKCQSLPLACAIEMQGKGESLRLREHLTKEGKFSVFVVMHEELEERVFTDLTNVPDVMIVEAPPPECIDLTSEANATVNTEATCSSAVVTAVLDERPPESVDLTSDVNVSQRTEQVATTSEADLSQSTEIYSLREKQPPACATRTVENPAEKASFFPEIMMPSDVISVRPVPRLGGNTQWRCAVAFLNYGAEYKSVEYCQGNLFGVSYNYCLVCFNSPASAVEWYYKCQGSIKITNKAFPNSKRKRPSRAFLHFSDKNWVCECGKENCHVRSICFSCFKRRGETVPIFVSSPTPTKYLAVKLLKKLPVAELAAIFPKIRCTMFDVVSIKFICDPKVQKDNFGVHILETKFLEGAIALRNYYKKSLVVQSTSYVVLKDRTAGTVIDLGSLVPAAFPGAEDSVTGNGLDVVSHAPEPDYDAIIWTSLHGFRLNKPPNNVVMMSFCLEYQELPDKTKVQIQDSLKEAGVTTESMTYSFKGDVGSPFSYCLISFDSLDTAKKWFDKCKDTFQIEICRPDDQKLPLSFQNCFSVKKTSDGGASNFIKSKLYYSQPNWTCNCGTSNFFLRTVCHACFKNKNKESGYSVSDATKFVGIKLTECLETVDTSSLYDVRNYGYDVTKINIGLDPAVPRDPFGIMIFEMQTLSEGIKFHRFLTSLMSCINRGQKKNYPPVIETLMKILRNSSGITFLTPS